MTAKKRERMFTMLAATADVAAHLPGPGESLHALITGVYDLTELIDAILERTGPAEHIRISTMSFGRDNARLMTRWLVEGLVQKLSLLGSTFFERAHKPECQLMRELLVPPHRYGYVRNHSKVITINFPPAPTQDAKSNAPSFLSIEGSANLRTCDHLEQIVITNDRSVYDWHANWIDAQLDRIGNTDNREWGMDK